MVDNAAILENIQAAFDENAASMTLTKTARDGTTTTTTVLGFRKRVVDSQSSDIRADTGVSLGDSEIILEADAEPAPGDLLDVFGTTHVIRSPVIPINPLGTLFAWAVMARRLET